MPSFFVPLSGLEANSNSLGRIHPVYNSLGRDGNICAQLPSGGCVSALYQPNGGSPQRISGKGKHDGKSSDNSLGVDGF